MTKRLGLGALSGALLVASFPPFDQGWAAWFALVPLLFALQGASRKSAFLAGLSSGVVFYLGSVYWVVNSMYHYGGVGLWVSVPVMLLLVIYLALYTAVFGLVASRLDPGSPLWALAVPSVWVALEYLRGYLFTGFPWVSLGYSQYMYLPVIQVADIAGVWGVSFVVVCANVAVFGLMKLLTRVHPSRGHSPVATALALVLLTTTLAYGFIRINQADTRARGWETLRVAAVQGNIDQSLKWDASYRKRTIDIYRSLTRRAASRGAELVVWPETAVPFYLGKDTLRAGPVLQVSEKTGSYVFTGSPSYDFDPGTGSISYFNSAYLISPDSGLEARYDKVHLVPFGEYVPLKRFLPFVRKLTAGVGDFSSGPGPLPLDFKGTGLGVLICFESIFPDLARSAVASGAGLLVNITNDAWFGRSSAPYQHLGMSALRAVENKVYLVRSANTGISAVVDPAGRITGKTGLFKEDVLVEDVGVRTGPLTVYASIGDAFSYFAFFIAFVSIIFIRVNKREVL